MAYPDKTTPRSYGGSVPPAYITSDVPAYYTPNQTITMSSLAGWYEIADTGQATLNPLGTRGPFVIAVNLGQSNEEKILCSAADIENSFITVWTDGVVNGRGYDGTIISTHPRQTTQIKTADTYHVSTAVESLQFNEGIIAALVGGQGGQGAQGVQGAQGSAGSQGAQGAQGSAGSQGAQGDSGTGTQGPQGDNGSQGQGFTYQGAYSDTRTYAPYDVVTGSDGSTYITSSIGDLPDPTTPGQTDWTLFTSVGAQGPQGESGTGGGSQGPQGYQGADGAQGSQGDLGPQGNDGSQGPQGAQGAGTQGAQGAQGTGAQGNDGAQGPQGFTGDPGIYESADSVPPTNVDILWLDEIAPAAVGPQGTQGVQGAQGARGYQGSVGAQGANGSNGSNGNQGSQGPQGYQGATGYQGSQGNNGPQGFQGADGSYTTSDSGWIAVSSFTNSFVVGAAVAYRKLNGIVYLRGSVQSGTPANAAFTLPTGYRPSETSVFAIQQYGLTTNNYITINTDGTVVPQTASAWLNNAVYPIG